MIKVLQYGEGNFLRAFADVYFDECNLRGGQYEVFVVKPRPGGSLEAFHRQNNRYHVITRGMETNAPVERVRQVSSIAKAIHPFRDKHAYLSLAADPELKLIVSNTTDAGIRFDSRDTADGFESITFPAKLTQFLYARYRAGQEGVYLLPTELIDSNADQLLWCVEQYITLWQLPEEFRRWNREKNFYCNTLVDRIVSGYPKDPQTLAHLEDLIGGPDPLMTVCEPFGLWVIEKKGELEALLPTGKCDIDVVLTGDVRPYKLRKVRVLNASHTNLVAAGLLLGAQTVCDCMHHDTLSAFLEQTLQKEILPFLPDGATFAESVKERFLNPYLNHQLTSIALNSIAKWRARVLPCFRDYYAKTGTIAPCMTAGFSYLMALYASICRDGEQFYAQVPGRTVLLQDDPAVLQFFAQDGKLLDFLADQTVWGEDLTAYEGFAETVLSNVEKIRQGVCLL